MSLSLIVVWSFAGCMWSVAGAFDLGLVAVPDCGMGLRGPYVECCGGRSL